MEIRKDSLLYSESTRYDYIDSYAYVIVDENDRIGLLEVAQAFSKPGPKWMNGLFVLRNKIASVFKLKTPVPVVEEDSGDGDSWEVGKQAGIFKVYGRTDTEMVVGEDDKHLDIRVSLFLESDCPDKREKKVTVTTVVKIHNGLGKCYFFFVKPVHRIIVPLMLKQKFRELEAEVKV